MKAEEILCVLQWQMTKCSKTRLEISSAPVLFQLSDNEAVEWFSLLHLGGVLGICALQRSTCKSDAVLIQLN